MKQNIKLRDLTEKQYKTWLAKNCYYTKSVNCNTCPFLRGVCSLGEFCWVKNKDIYSDKFLDQEIKIKIELLTPKEKEYLENLLRPFKEVVDFIEKANSIDKSLQFIRIKLCDGERINLPYFNFNEYYKNLESDKEYTLKDLGLFQSKYKITLSEFWNSKDKLAIHCDTEEKANKFIKESNKTNKWGDFGNYYKDYKEKTCYSNDSDYYDLNSYKEDNYTIYEFDEVDLED